MADHIRFEADFSEWNAFLAKSMRQIDEQVAKSVALGDEALTAQLRAQRAKLEGLTKGQADPAGAAQIERANREIVKQNALKRAGTEIDTANLEILRETLRVEAEREAIFRLHMEAGSLAPLPRLDPRPEGGGILPLARTPRTYEQTAGGLAAQEELEAKAARAQAELNARAAQFDAELEAQTGLRQKNIRLAEETLALDQKEVAALGQQRVLMESLARAHETGRAAALGNETPGSGAPLTPKAQRRVLAPPPESTEEWTKAERKLLLYNVELGKYEGYANKASVSSQYLNANLTRLGVAEAEASNQLRRHGALTTEFLGALARGETTVQEFGYQIGATIGKFAGWTAAATATYGALGAVFEFGKGALDAASGVQRLTRTIDGLDRSKANKAIIDLSSGTNVPIKEAADAIFRYSRTFHDLPTATAAAKLGLSAFKLDQVDINSSVKTSTGLLTQFHTTASGLRTVYDELAAGQREYNARMQEMIPLIGKSVGAVKNAGGDLNGLIQLGTYAQRTLPLIGGSNIGTAFYRSASNFLNPTTTKGKADRSVLEQLGVNPNQGWTTVLRDALVKSVTLSKEDRSRLSNAIFGPQYGGRLSGLFNPATVPTFLDIQQHINPKSTEGSLQKELDKELATAHERLHSFVNEMQRFGAAVGDSGVVNFFTLFIGGLVKVGSVIREVVQGFDALPGVVKEAVTGLVLLRATMLFLNRTRFGASFGPISRVARIPGLDPGFEAQRARATLTTGTRSIINSTEDEIAQSSARSIATGIKQQNLVSQRAAIERRIAAGSGETADLQVRSNVLNERIEALTKQQIAIETEKSASQAALVGLREQQRGLASRRTGFSDEKVLALAGSVEATTKQAEAGATDVEAKTAVVSTGAQSRLAAAKARLAGLLRLNTAATDAAAVAMGEEAVAADAAAVASEEAGVVAEESAGGLSRMIGGLAGMLDPLLLVLIGVPLAIEQFQATARETDEQTKRIKGIVNKTPTVAGGQQLTHLIQSSQINPDAFSNNQAAIIAYLRAVSRQENQWVKQGGLARQVEQAFSRSTSAIHRVTQQIATIDPRDFFDSLSTLSTKQLTQQVQTSSNRAGVYGLGGNDLKRAGETYLFLAARYRNSNDQKGLQLVTQAQQAFVSAVTKNVQDAQKAAESATTPGGASADLSRATSTIQSSRAHVEQWVAQMTKKFHRFPGIIRAVSQAAQQIEAQLNDQLKSALDQQIQLIEQNASLAASQIGGFSPADDIARAETTLGGLRQALSTARSQGAGWQVIAGLMTQINSSAHDIAKQRIDQAKAILDAQGALASSRISGTGPEAEIARARQSITNARNALSFDQSSGAGEAQVLRDQAGINDAVRQLNEQIISRDRAIIEAQGQLAVSQVTGIGPAADIARARKSISNAANLLGFDRSHHAGQAQILIDQAAVNDAQRSLNEQIQSQDQQLSQDLAAFIQSQTDLAKSRTTDPIRQARDELSGANRQLHTIKPSDFKTNQEYQTAVNEAKAKINNDRTSLREQILQVDMRNLDFELHTQRITDQQYINGLQRLLRMKHLTMEERQQILTQIFDATHQATVDLNTDSIRLPTTYEVKRAIASSMRRAGAGGGAGAWRTGGGGGDTHLGGATTNHNTYHNNVRMDVTVGRNVDIHKFAKVLDDALGSNFKTGAQASGVI